MKMHNLCSIDMTDIMLMPLPSDLSNSDWSPELEITCEALIEYTFLLQMHIMDWLRIHKMEHNWWKLINNESDDNLIRKIVKGYQGRELFKILEKPTDDQFIDSSDNVHNVNKNPVDIEFIDTSFIDKDKNPHSTNVISDKNVSENEDNPCISTDIAFVDCGPTSVCFEPESSTSYMSRKQVVTKARTNNQRKSLKLKDPSSLEIGIAAENATTIKVNEKNCNENPIKLSSKGPMQHCRIVESFAKKIAGNSVNKSIETGVGKIADNPLKISIPFSAKKVQLYKANSDQSLQAALNTNCSPKIYTVQGSKDMDITSVINTLPPYLLSNNKKLVFLGQNSSGLVTFCSKNETTEKKLNKPVANNDSTNINILPQRMGKPIAIRKLQEKKLTGKIVIKNGKNFIIKHTENLKNPGKFCNLPIVANASRAVSRPTIEHNTSTSASTSIGETENVGTKQTTLFQNDISILTPSPSSSELSSGSNCELYVKQTKFRKAPPQLISINSKNMFETISMTKDENGDIFMNVKLADYFEEEIADDMYEVISKYREEMMNEFYQLDGFELKKRIAHLKHVNEEMRKSMNFISDDVLKEKLRSITTLQRILEDCFHKCNKDNDVQEKKNVDVILNEWETEFKELNLSPKCSSCRKIMKPKSYIAGFSKLSYDDNAYCTCYKYVCHECLSYYGTLSRFIAHRNFHKKAKPYICPDCRCKFISTKLLEIHMWTVCFHMLKKRIFACKICEIDGFRDLESITRHFAVMHSITKIACEDCFKVFCSYSEYMEHSMETHPTTSKHNPVRLVICRPGDEVIRCENYMSYLEKYGGVRKLTWLKCPFCPLVTPENKHMKAVLNAHLRDKHSQDLSKMISKTAWNEIFGAKCSKAAISNSDAANTFVNSNVAPCENDGTVMPKIVNTRTITSEVFESGSQETDDTWSANSAILVPTTTVTVLNVSSLVTRKVNDREKPHMLPKILDVRSMADLKITESKTTAKIAVTKAREKHNFRTSESEVDVQDRERNSFSREDAEETTELDDNGSNRKEGIEKIKQSDKSNNDLTSTESEKTLPPKIDDDCGYSSIESSERISDFESTVYKTSAENRIKVVDIRTICKPSSELFVATKPCYIRSETKNRPLLPKPPPLARIPQHLLELGKATRSNNKSRRNVTKSKTVARRVTSKPRQRIAINDSTEECVEFLCHLCGERINTSWSVIRKHFSEKHSHEYQLAMITPQLLRLSSDFIENGYKQILSKKRKSDITLFTSKRKRRWTPKKHMEMKDTSASDIGLCVEQETAEDGEGNFRCKKCDQRCTDMSDLREHIATNHRLKGRYLICLECGENFVVAPSLQMHLKAFHGIEDPVSYMSQNPSYASDINSDLESEGKTTVANQCYVCMAVFEDKAAVDKHLRVHGMAFLNRKRIEARNALKSPEKRPNAEEDKQSPVKESPKETVRQDKPAETILGKLNVSKLNSYLNEIVES